MSLFIWEGNGTGTKSDFDDGRNWVNEAGTNYAEARYPGSIAGTLDEVLFLNALGTTASSPAAYDGSADEALLSLTIAPGYDGAIGTTGSPVSLKVAKATINASGASANSIHLDFINQATDADVMVLGGTGLKLSGYMRYVKAIKGNAAILDGSTVADLFVGFESSQLTDMQLLIGEEGGTGVTVGLLNQIGGYVESHNLLPLAGAGNPIGLSLVGGTWVEHGGLTNLFGYGGTFDWVAGNLNSIQVFGVCTVNTSNGSMPRHVEFIETLPGGTLDLDNDLGNIRVLDYVLYRGCAFTPPNNTNWGLLGTYHVEDGIEPHTGNSGSSPTVSTDWMQMTTYDHLHFACAKSGAGTVAYTIEAAEDDSGTDAEDITVDCIWLRETESGTAPAWSAEYGIWGHTLPAGKPFVRITATHETVDDSTASVVVTRRRF